MEVVLRERPRRCLGLSSMRGRLLRGRARPGEIGPKAVWRPLAARLGKREYLRDGRWRTGTTHPGSAPGHVSDTPSSQ